MYDAVFRKRKEKLILVCATQARIKMQVIKKLGGFDSLIPIVAVDS